MRPMPAVGGVAVAAIPAVPKTAHALAACSVPVRRFEYRFYVPLEDYVRMAREDAEELWEAVEDNFLRFEQIWDPMKYIVKRMLEPQLFTRTATTDIYEFCGRFYFERTFPGDDYHRIVDGKLTEKYLGGAAPLATDPWALDGIWGMLNLEDGWALANRATSKQ